MQKIRLLFLILSFVMFFNVTVVLAEVETVDILPNSGQYEESDSGGNAYKLKSQEELEKSYNQLSKVLNAVLSAFSWFGYAVAVGVLIFIGLKYVMSNASEKANLKGLTSKYLIGVALVVLCSTIAAAVANIANTSGENTETGIVNKGIEISGLNIGGKNLTAEERREYQEMIEKLKQVEKSNQEAWNTERYKYGHIVVHTPIGVNVIKEDGVGADPKYTVDTIYNDGKEFKYWLVNKVNTKSLEKISYKETDTTFLAQGSDRFWDILGPADYTYEVWAIYE